MKDGYFKEFIFIVASFTYLLKFDFNVFSLESKPVLMENALFVLVLLCG